MKIHPDFTIQKVGASYVAVPIGEKSKEFHAMLRLNETGAFLWKQMTEKDCTEEDLTDALLAEYQVERELAARDVHRIVTQLSGNGILI